jgi:tyrosyl-tRNA synthetase
VYQYFINTADEDIEKYLKLFTFLDENEIKNITKEHTKSPQNRK